MTNTPDNFDRNSDSWAEKRIMIDTATRAINDTRRQRASSIASEAKMLTGCSLVITSISALFFVYNCISAVRNNNPHAIPYACLCGFVCVCTTLLTLAHHKTYKQLKKISNSSLSSSRSNGRERE